MLVSKGELRNPSVNMEGLITHRKIEAYVPYVIYKLGEVGQVCF